ncbi:MAG: 23S rRNA (adenine(2503)-C(2))-methyltransferase RlmN [Deltaproteobacteria bacterium]|nr:23S rRNA (adenine(2503)-C(2))-methyltransferase RlmN [Deltaproteobacteria bacterium]MCL5277392.1 23S rRNA (adenine(2503)-C(2))-methyltransferase RlmN [Deltaproteobacteria bacterium]
MQRTDIKSLSFRELEQALKGLGMPAYSAGQIFVWLYKRHATDFGLMTNISKPSRLLLAQHFEIGSLKPLARQTGRDGTTKYQFMLSDGYSIESVLIPMGRWHTLCLSTQVGCALGCRFCLTGIKGFKRNLSVSEITCQLELVQAENPGTPVSHIVFMGMGEPFANYDNTLRAIDVLTSEYGYQYSHRRVTVSTAGLVPQIRRFIGESRANLAVSLNALYDDTRTAMMPINSRYPLGELIDVLKDYHKKRKGWITFEYVMIKGVNDGIGHAIQLAKLTRDFPFKVNLIPLNRHRGADYERPDDDRVQAFQEYLLGHNIVCMVRTTHGEEIDAACGQLGGGKVERNTSDLPQDSGGHPAQHRGNFQGGIDGH